NEIKVKKLPELDEELVKELNVPNVTTAEEFTAFIKNRMETTKKKNADAKAFDEVLEKIVNASSVEIPDVMIEEETDNLMMEFSQRLQNAGYTVEDFATASGKSNEDIRKEMAEDAVGRVKTRLVLEAIAKAEGIKVTPQEIEEEVKSLAKRHNMTEEKVRQLARLDLIAYDVALRKATDFIRESCK
ncbi:MAG: trigger factor, partial [Erysipelotrichales bacterium]|nr:trigger factor [Erysipelotrichales bacterium]